MADPPKPANPEKTEQLNLPPTDNYYKYVELVLGKSTLKLPGLSATGLVAIGIGAVIGRGLWNLPSRRFVGIFRKCLVIEWLGTKEELEESLQKNFATVITNFELHEHQVGQDGLKQNFIHREQLGFFEDFMLQDDVPAELQWIFDEVKKELEENQKDLNIDTSMPEEEPVQLLKKVWPEDRGSAGEIYRILTFNVIPKELVSRLLARVFTLITKSDGNLMIWRYGVCLELKSALALIRVKTQPNNSDEMEITIRARDPQDAKGFMELIVESIFTTTLDHPGVTLHQNVRSPHEPETLIKLEEVLAEASKDSKFIKCPTTRKEIPISSILLTAGFDNLVGEVLERNPTTETQEVKKEISLARRDLIHNTKKILKHAYPKAFILLPAADPIQQGKIAVSTGGNLAIPKKEGFLASLAKLQGKTEQLKDEAFFEKSRLYCLCEFQIRDEKDPTKMQQCWHPVKEQEGVEVKELNAFTQKVGPVLKASAVILKAVPIGAKCAGVPIPNLGGALNLVTDYCDKASDMVEKIRGQYDGLEAETDEKAADAMQKEGPGSIKPKALEGDNLLAMKEKFGEPAAGYLPEARLRQCFVRFDGPFGNVGDVLWLCERHAAVVDKQNRNLLAGLKLSEDTTLLDAWGETAPFHPLNSITLPEMQSETSASRSLVKQSRAGTVLLETTPEGYFRVNISLTTIAEEKRSSLQDFLGELSGKLQCGKAENHQLSGKITALISTDEDEAEDAFRKVVEHLEAPAATRTLPYSSSFIAPAAKQSTKGTPPLKDILFVCIVVAAIAVLLKDLVFLLP